MIKTQKHWKIGNYNIFLMTDAGAIWYELSTDNGEFLGNYDTYEEARKEIDHE